MECKLAHSSDKPWRCTARLRGANVKNEEVGDKWDKKLGEGCKVKTEKLGLEPKKQIEMHKNVRRVLFHYHQTSHQNTHVNTPVVSMFFQKERERERESYGSVRITLGGFHRGRWWLENMQVVIMAEITDIPKPLTVDNRPDAKSQLCLAFLRGT